MQTPSEKIIARKEGGIGWIIFNNPARHNAMSLEMWEAMRVGVDAFSRDEEVRVIILRGEGGKAFVAGADISQFKEKRTSAEAVRVYNATSEAASVALQNCRKPTIAMIRGYCIGGGTGIAAGCDIRIAADDARFAITAAKLGLGYRYAGIKRVADLVGPSFTAEIFFTARQFSAAEALAMNLVNRVVAVAELEQYTLNYANAIVANAPLTIAAVKRCLIEYQKPAQEQDLGACQAMIDTCFASDDYKEGQSAFMEKRKAVFKDR